MTGEGERIARLETRVESMDKILSRLDETVRGLQLKVVGAVGLVVALIEMGFRMWGKA